MENIYNFNSYLHFDYDPMMPRSISKNSNNPLNIQSLLENSDTKIIKNKRPNSLM